jgi:predicted RNA-binding Zn ribbon-like protein
MAVVTERQREFRFEGGATWLNLLATRGQTFGPRPIERLTSPARLADWLAHCELTPVRAPTTADLARTRELRQALSTLALAVVDGDEPPAEPVARVLEFAAGEAGPVRLATGAALRREPPATPAHALARIARQALDQLTGPERRHLVSCAEHDCRWVFLDLTGRRRWCPSPSCASRGRVRALRARRKAAAG